MGVSIWLQFVSTVVTNSGSIELSYAVVFVVARREKPMRTIYLIANAVFAAIVAFTLFISTVEAQHRGSTDATITFFYYEDVEAAAAFYERILGFEMTMNQDWVKILRITPTSSVGLVQQGRGFHDVSEDKPAMLSIVTENIDAWYDFLVEADVVIRKELPDKQTKPKPTDAPVRGFVVEDPGGYTVEFFSWQNTE
jgi:catechol 2,3-dioxygenase-like lactoylglutathione lyase family enzyme